jgi:hypothetical protein
VSCNAVVELRDNHVFETSRVGVHIMGDGANVDLTRNYIADSETHGIFLSIGNATVHLQENQFRKNVSGNGGRDGQYAGMLTENKSVNL